MSASEHYTAFVRWLCIKGIVNYKDDITIAVAAKSYLLLILLYLHARYFSIAIEPPEQKRREVAHFIYGCGCSWNKYNENKFIYWDI